MRIDTSGLSCPEPVLRAKKAIQTSPDQLEVVVDNTTALNNVTRFLQSQKYQVTSEDFLIKAKK